MSDKIKVAFVCVHNSCRSQIAQALGKHLCSDVFDSYSAGTHIASEINQDALRIMKDKYDITMEETQYPKVLQDIPKVDIVITMGCNVDCPIVFCAYRTDWGLDDPSGKDDACFLKTIAEIETKILELKKLIMNKEIIIGQK